MVLYPLCLEAVGSMINVLLELSKPDLRARTMLSEMKPLLIR